MSEAYRFINTCELIKMLDIRKIGKHNRRIAMFRCYHCGKLFEATYYKVQYPKSCGCKSVVFDGGQNVPMRYGERNTPLYNVYSSMKQRCTNPNRWNYKNYGGRGITICKEWMINYVFFRDWAISNGYQYGLELDRIDNNGNYESSNCRFVTTAENCRNRRSTILTVEQVIEIRSMYKKETAKYSKLAIKYKVSATTIWDILNNRSWKNI